MYEVVWNYEFPSALLHFFRAEILATLEVYASHNDDDFNGLTFDFAGQINVWSMLIPSVFSTDCSAVALLKFDR